MQRRSRTILLLGATLLFAIVAPLVVFHAIGYRLNSTRLRQPVGVILIESIPRLADIEVNGIPSGTTPEGISDIPAGTVNVKITKPGYAPWQKNVNVESRRTTDLGSIRLFPEKPVSSVFASRIHTFAVSPNQRLIASVQSDRNLTIYDIGGEIISGPYPLSALPERLVWSPDSTFLLLPLKGRSPAIQDLSNPKQPPFEIKAIKSPGMAVWDPRIPGRLLWQNGLALEAYTIATASSVPLAQNVSAFTATNRRIFFIDTANRLNSVSLYGEPSGAEPLVLDQTVKQIIPARRDTVMLHLADGRLLLSSGQDVKEILPLAKHFILSPDGRMLLFQAHENEIAVYNLTDEQFASILPLEKSQLIARVSRTIANPQWFAGGRHAMYQLGDEIVITEIDVRDYPISTVIDSTNLGNANPTVIDEGERMFYIKRQGETTYLSRTELAVP